jgi:hypothetical protein
MTGPLMVHQAVEYEIRVQGKVRENWSAWFDGLAISPLCESGVGLVTVITGRIEDQAALHGILNKIRDLNLTLLLVLCRSTLHEYTEKEINIRDQRL